MMQPTDKTVLVTTEEETVEDSQPDNQFADSFADAIPAPATEITSDSYLDAAIAVTEAVATDAGWSRLGQFLAEPNVGHCLSIWFGKHVKFDGSDGALDRDTLAARIQIDVSRLDALINDQINAIIHHEQYQKLEASWRGLHYLTQQARDAEGVKIKVLNISWRDLSRDLERAIEFDQSQMFNKIYNEEFGTPGGEPFGAILGDYEVTHRINPEHMVDDVATVQGLSQIAAAAFAPMIMSAHPALFGFNDYADMGGMVNLPRTFQQSEYQRWQTLRETEDSRFIGLTLPKTLMRVPLEDDGSREDQFRFNEQVAGPDNTRYLWGNAVYSFGSVLIRAFGQSGWLADIQGVQRGVDAGGLVTGLPVHSFATDVDGIAPKYSTDVLISDSQEKELSDLGFMPLCMCKDTPYSAYYGSASIQKPKVYDRTPATMNARLSAMLQYMFCVSRFAHYIKVIGRDRVGSFTTADECEQFLQQWLYRYTIDVDDAGLETKARAPLREGRVEVREQPGKPGTYYCVMHLRPHFQLDQVISSVRLVTELSPENK